MFDRDGASGFQICGVDSEALRDAPVTDLPVACEITIVAESAAPEELAFAERDLERITDSLHGRLVATSRSRTTLLVLVYLPSDDDADAYTRIAVPRTASVSVAPAIDPTWSLFDAARPAGLEEQSMRDFRIRNRLFEAGDTGGIRQIDHIVTGLSEETVEGFMAAVSAVFVTVEGESQGDDFASWKVSHPGDLGEVTIFSWTIRLIAERYGATYDRWECEVVGAAEPSARRLFRRR